MKRLITPECPLDSIKPSKRLSTYPSVENISQEDSSNIDANSGVFIESDECFEAMYDVPSVKNFLFSKSLSPICTIIEPEAIIDIETKAKGVNSLRNLDLRTGICFNIGEGHFNKAIRLHQEWPMRITSVLNHLRNVPRLKERCALFGEKLPVRKDIEVFLNDDGYLRVHLPGYMRR